MCSAGIPWQPSGWDSALSLPRAGVGSLVGELRSHGPHCVTKTWKKRNVLSKFFYILKLWYFYMNIGFIMSENNNKSKCEPRLTITRHSVLQASCALALWLYYSSALIYLFKELNYFFSVVECEKWYRKMVTLFLLSLKIYFLIMM